MNYLLRSLTKSPGFTLIALLTFGLGIGASTAIFSVLYAVMLRPFAYPNADQLVVLRQHGPKMEMSVSWPTAQDWIREQQAFTALSIFRGDRFNIADSGQLPDNFNGAYASASLFDVAGLPAVRGRYFSASEDRAGADPVVVISERLWIRRYNRDAEIVGCIIPVDGVRRTVIGVAPAALDLPIGADVWLPIAPYAAKREIWQSRGVNVLSGIGRLKPGLTIAQAAADMERIYVDLRRAFPGELTAISAVVESYRESQVGSFRRSLWLLLGATGVLLAIACANVAGLFITRGIQQERDHAVRAALGASRAQLVRQMLLEPLVVAALGGVIAVLLAPWLVSLIEQFVPADQPRFHHIELNGWVLGFAMVIATIAGASAGLWPALKFSRADVRTTLHESSRSTTAGTGVRKFLVAAQVALTVVLLSVSGLVLRSLDRIHSAELGFDAASVLTFNIALPGSRYREDQARDFYQRFVDQIAQLPGVVSAAVNTTPPLAVIKSGWQQGFSAENGVDDRDPELADMGIVSDTYFSTLKIPILQGRAFTAQDAAGPKVAIIDQAFATKYWPGQSPLGKRVYWGPPDDRRDEYWFTVVGVVPTLRMYGYSEERPRPQAYWSLRQSAWLSTSVLVRTGQNPRTLEKPVRELLASLDPEIAAFGLATLGDKVAETYQGASLQSFLLNLFAAIAFVLALAGLYGVVSYGVAMRQREIGLRMALGAQARDIIGLVLRQGMTPFLAGGAAGLAGALAAAQIIRSQLYESSSADFLTLGAAVLVLALATAASCWLPARRATRIAPLTALRGE